MSILKKLTNEGSLVLYQDYRSGTAIDWSGYNNHGTLTDTIWTGCGIEFPITSSEISVADSSELQILTGAVVLLGDFNNQSVFRLLSKRDGGGTNFDTACTATTVTIYDGSATRSLTVDIVGTRFIGINVPPAGGICEGFVDGVTAGAFSGTTTLVANDAPLIIGNYYTGSNNLNNNIKAAVIVDRMLTATEWSELYSELSSMCWPKKITTTSNAIVRPNQSDSTLAGSWGMVPTNNKIIDISDNGNDGTIVRAFYEETSLSNALSFDGTNSYTTHGTDTSLDIGTGDFTVSCWFKALTGGVIQMILCKGTATSSAEGYAVRLDASNIPSIFVSDGSSYVVNNQQGDAVGIGVWNKIDVVFDRDANCTIYVNGAVSGTPASIASWNGVDISSGSRNFWIGTINGSVQMFDGLISNVELFNEAKDSDWIIDQYRRGLMALWKTSWGAHESAAAVTSGDLENTPFRVSTGSFKITKDTINTEPVTVIECVSAGICYVPTSYFQQTPTEAAYGTWEWWVYKDLDGNSLKIYFIDGGSGTGPGYYIDFRSDEAIEVYETGVSSKMLTATSYMSIQTWYKAKMTRDSSTDEFTAYLDDVPMVASTGSNPFVDSSTTVSDYFVLDLDAGDKVAFASLSGEYNITKKLLV